MSMYAVVTQPGLFHTTNGLAFAEGFRFPEVGQRIEVVGFVHFARETWAAWLDDEGRLHEIPIDAIRMEPAKEVTLASLKGEEAYWDERRAKAMREGHLAR